MNNKILLPIIIIISAIAVFLIPEDTSMPSSENLYQYGFTFYDVEKINASLSEQNIFMSTPTPVTDHTIGNYCAIRDDILSKINYCTTTAIQNSDGRSLGNISMGGTPDNPIMAIAAIDSSTSFDSKSNEVELSIMKHLNDRLGFGVRALHHDAAPAVSYNSDWTEYGLFVRTSF